MRQFQMNKQSWRKRSMSAADITGDLPIYNPASAVGRRESSTSAMKYKLIHLIPLVVMLCFFILWCFSSPGIFLFVMLCFFILWCFNLCYKFVDLETKDGRTTFVPRSKSKKPPQSSEAGDLDLTVLALESPPDGFLSVSDGPYASVTLLNQPNVSLMDSHDHSASSTDSHVQNTSLSDSHELKTPFAISHEPSAPFSDIHDSTESTVDFHELNASFSASHDAKLLFLVSDEPRPSYEVKSNKPAQQASGEG
ncbi:hypothetical protein HanRHA438_Chr05g0206371 [Helianthus annuus]|uniref:Uncharacterized protein n=1 Tax=Helianthus annuus TaxID=4232 RepID=A0A9K3IYN3_HELAN|nr:hypothetical protein HanXRQr2_Chr05g0196911 [Helianthus annuus]KAJ0569063.1 hypothetical protein HanHA300_Chr05g0161791 [Helianthus annuus]KAJ0583342.1 hypothetical protein HanHA89_Chr05g0175461 [Helianthus annuus]KAJ0746076.1 hypothetical protein HanOQP8_Chr05g0173381 [Helianthus annuus]KAJ0749082.1 hypothetical protein HanLR1_Chr05g0165681 [Helianthus annuus]